jgi:hypothetical protein
MARKRRVRNDTDAAPVSPVIPIVDTRAPLTPPEPPPDPDDPSPIGDVLLVDQARMKALADKGLDTNLVRVRVERFSEEHNKFSRLEGEFPPEVVTVKWLRKKFGPGSYMARGLNAGGMFLASGRVSIEALPEPVTPQVVAASSTPNLNFTEMLLLKLIEGPRAAPVAPQQDDLRETLAAMSKMIAMQMQAATMSQLRSQVAGQPNGHGSDEKLYELLKQIVLTGGTAKREKGGIEEFLPLLQLGISLGARAALPGGAKENPNELPPWLSVVPEVADTLGVPLIATLAQALLPPDKAKVVLDVMSEHQQARKAEADASTVEVEQ